MLTLQGLMFKNMQLVIDFATYCESQDEPLSYSELVCIYNTASGLKKAGVEERFGAKTLVAYAACYLPDRHDIAIKWLRTVYKFLWLFSYHPDLLMERLVSVDHFLCEEDF